MNEKKNIDFIVRNYINTNIILPWNSKIKKIHGGEYKKEFIIEYKGNEYIFKRLHDDKNKLVLYSYDGELEDCVSLVIDKEKKKVSLTSFGKYSGCFQEETNIGSNLLKITLKMIEKYKDYFKINKITLRDTSTFYCKTNEPLDMAIMKTLLTGDTWYGAYGFRPYTLNNELSEVGNKIYNENKKIMNTLLLKDLNIEKYLLLINKKFPKEFTKETILNIINYESKKPKRLLKDFLLKFNNLKTFDVTCKYFSIFYRELFNDIGLKLSGDFYGKEI